MLFSDMTPHDKQTLIEHIAAFRRSAIISVVAIVACAFVAFAYSEELLKIIVLPLAGQKLIVTTPTEAFYVKLEISFITGFIMAFPVVILAAWNFLKPALFPHERRYIYILFPVAVLLFVVGIMFSYFVVLRMVLAFLVTMSGENLENFFKVADYFSFVLWFSLPFGLVFELPVIIWFLARLGWVNQKTLTQKRKYAIVIIFVCAAMLTPGPDPISQVMMAGPVLVLYEISALVARFANPKNKTKEEKKLEGEKIQQAMEAKKERKIQAAKKKKKGGKGNKTSDNEGTDLPLPDDGGNDTDDEGIAD